MSAATKSGDVPVSVFPSGFPSMRMNMLTGIIGLTVTYIVTIQLFPYFEHLLPPPAEEFCVDDSHISTVTGKCSRPDLFAFEVSSGCALYFCGLLGFYTWHVTKSPFLKLPSTPEGRLFGYLPEAQYITAAATTFQFWDLIISFIIPEQRTVIMIAHHSLAALVSWYGLNNQYFHYYAIFFLGCSEISALFLIFVDIAKFNPPVPGTAFDLFIGVVAGPAFAVTFLYYRVYLWWQVSYLMYTDIKQVLSNGMADNLRPGRNHVLYLMVLINLLLGILQLYWTTIILEEAAIVFGLKEKSSA